MWGAAKLGALCAGHLSLWAVVTSLHRVHLSSAVLPEFFFFCMCFIVIIVILSFFQIINWWANQEISFLKVMETSREAPTVPSSRRVRVFQQREELRLDVQKNFLSGSL